MAKGINIYRRREYVLECDRHEEDGIERRHDDATVWVLGPLGHAAHRKALNLVSQRAGSIQGDYMTMLLCEAIHEIVNYQVMSSDGKLQPLEWKHDWTSVQKEKALDSVRWEHKLELFRVIDEDNRAGDGDVQD